MKKQNAWFSKKCKALNDCLKCLKGHLNGNDLKILL